MPSSGANGRQRYAKMSVASEPSVGIVSGWEGKMTWLKYTSKTQAQEVKLSDLGSKIVKKVASCLENFVYSIFSGDENTDFSTFLSGLTQPSSYPVSNIVLHNLSVNDKNLLTNYQNGRRCELSSQLARCVVVQCLNKTIGGSCIYERERFNGVNLRTVTTELIAHNATLFSQAQINRLLLEDTYESALPRNQNFFSRDTGDRERTKLIKVALSELGHETPNIECHYKVYANQLPLNMCQEHGGEYNSREWLYDLHWYTEVDHYQPTSLPLVVECQWRPKRNEDSVVPYSDCKFDFQKLLVANAGLRLMIFKIRKGSRSLEDREKLGKYFDKAIESYSNLLNGAEFLFIAFDEGDEGMDGFYYAERRKGQEINGSPTSSA
jgi:hypothetical protein